MLPYHFAGPIFTTQEVITFCVVAITVLSLIVGSILFIGKRLMTKSAPSDTKKISWPKSVLIGFAVVGSIIILLLLPTFIKDRIWIHKQGTCAKQVGYSSPADDQSESATAESQAAYQKCLYPNGF